MKDSLFEIPETKSPRLKWIEAHNIQTFKTKCLAPEDGPWSAWSGDLTDALQNDSYGVGETEDDAIVEWAKMMKVKLWNEETP